MPSLRRLAQVRQSNMMSRTGLNAASRPRVPNKQGACRGPFSRGIKTMNDLFVRLLQDSYYPEKHLVRALLKMAGTATLG
jgi:hypothetical protein